jgi:hypothetical protein
MVCLIHLQGIWVPRLFSQSLAQHSAPVLTVLYLFRRDPGSNMVADFVTDGSGFLLG